MQWHLSMDGIRIELMDGPLEGFGAHLGSGWPVPEMISQRDPVEHARTHYYRVIGYDGEYRAYFDHSESKPNLQGLDPETQAGR